MKKHFTPDVIATGAVRVSCKREVTGTNLTNVTGEVTCLNCQRSEEFKNATPTTVPVSKIVADRSAMAVEINAQFSINDYVTVDMDGIRPEVYQFTDASAVSVYLEILTGGQQIIDTPAFHAAMAAGKVRKLSANEVDHLATEEAERAGDWDRQAIEDDAYVAEHAPEGATVYSYGRSWWVESHKISGITLGDLATGELITYPHDVMAAHLRDGKITHYPQPHHNPVVAESVDDVQPFRTSGKVKNTSKARRFRRGA